MSPNDVIDPQLLLRFAWRTAATLPADPLEPAPPVAPAALVEAPAHAESEEHEADPEMCADLARRVGRVWAMTPRARQRAATYQLLARLEPTRVGFMRLADHPLAAVRLWRLGVRHARALSVLGKAVLRRMPIVVGEPQVVDFLVEVVESGDDELARTLAQTEVISIVGRRFPALGARLAHVLEHGETWAARELAARWVVRVDHRGAVEPLRRAIRRPLLRLRACALEALLHLSPPPITAEDVQWLLDDAVKHPLPRAAGAEALDLRTRYEAALLEAVKVCPPPEGWRPLTVLADGGGEPMGFMHTELSRAWAITALAAGWPERVVARVDLALADSTAYRRVEEIEAAGLLPDALARPRLLEGAAFADPEVAERARDLWFQRFGEACPVSPLAGVPVALLDGPPSDALVARLTVLRGASAEAAGKVLDAAFAEAPSREALAFLLYSLRDLGDAHCASEVVPQHPSWGRMGMRRAEETRWAAALVTRFGTPGFDGLVALAERQVRAGVNEGWLGALALLAEKDALDEAQRDRLRDFAAGALMEAEEAPVWAVFASLRAVGAPASIVERLWSIALQPAAADPDPDSEPEDGPPLTVRGALNVLEDTTTVPGIDARLLQEAEAAAARGAWALVGELARSGAKRKTPGLLPLLERTLRAGELDPAALVAAERCVQAGYDAGHFGSKWFTTMLGRTSSPLFAAVAAAVPSGAPPGVVAALRRALDARSREGATAAEAATALVTIEQMATDHPRLDGILERAPEAQRERLACLLLAEGAPLAPLRRHLASLLLSRDEERAQNVFTGVEMCHQSEGRWEMLESVLEGGPTAGVREYIEHHLGAPSEAETYWRELGEEDEEEAIPGARG
jgi:hypothetical protein